MAGEEAKVKDTVVEASGNGSQAVAQIVASVSKLSVLELVELVKKLESTFGVSAAVPMMAGAMPMAAQGGAEAAAKEEKTEFTVMLTGFGDKKIQVIKVIRELTSLGLKEAKDLVDGVPSVVKEGISKAEAEDMKKRLEEAGGTVELK